MTIVTDLFSLEEQVAVVTGGTGVLGGAMARASECWAAAASKQRPSLSWLPVTSASGTARI